jgi:hypothetical protein
MQTAASWKSEEWIYEEEEKEYKVDKIVQEHSIT